MGGCEGGASTAGRGGSGARAPWGWRRARRVSWRAVGCRGGQWRGAWFPLHYGWEGTLRCTGAALFFGNGAHVETQRFFFPVACGRMGVRCGGGRRTPLVGGSQNKGLAILPP